MTQQSQQKQVDWLGLERIIPGLGKEAEVGRDMSITCAKGIDFVHDLNATAPEMQELRVSEGKNEGIDGGDVRRIGVTSQPISDSGSSKRIDLGKTPKQKPRRKKHRPKIVIEGEKPKQTAKLVTVKRVYVRRKGVNKLTTPSVNGDLDDSATLQPTMDSCRRALDFTQASIAIEGQVPSSSFMMDINTSKDMLKNKTRAAASEVGERRTKRKHSVVVERASNTNRTEVDYNILQGSGHWVDFPSSFKKNRSKKRPRLIVSFHRDEMKKKCSDNSDAKADLFAAKTSYLNSTPSPQLSTSPVPVTRKSGRRGLKGNQRTKLYLMASTRSERLAKRVSQKSAVCEVQDIFSAKDGLLKYLVSYTPHVPRKKRDKRITFISVIMMQPYHEIVIHEQPQLTAKLSDVVSGSTVVDVSSDTTDVNVDATAMNAIVDAIAVDAAAANIDSIAVDTEAAAAKARWQGFTDAITQRLKQLDINRESDRVINRERNASVPCNQDQKALVLHRSDGTIVPYNPVKAKPPRAKVHLDEETNRVFHLLLENINHEGVDGTDEEKRRWWEEERRVFCGRADSFVARMHLVQGDRRFSEWKGSVVDSVVGVYLTQNVSDHLSSSAYLSLAAHYPLKSNNNHKPVHEEEASLSSKEAEACSLKSDSEQPNELKNRPNQQVSDRSCMTFQDNDQNEEKVVNGNASTGIETVDVSLTGKLNCISLNSSESYVETCHGATANFAQHDIAPDVIISSQESVNSYQNICQHPVTETAERIGSYSQTNPEAEKLINRLQLNGLNDSTSLMDLLRMAGSTMLCEDSSCKCENSKDACSSSDQSKLTAESTSHGTVQKKVKVILQESSTSSQENNQSSNHQGEENIIQSQNLFVGNINAEILAGGQKNKVQQTMSSPNLSGEAIDIAESTINDEQKTAENKALREKTSVKQKSKRVGREINDEFDWDTLRREVEANGKKERQMNTMDALDWEAVRRADVSEIAETIKDRGMNNILAERIKAFLDRVVNDHGSIDLEWLREIEPDKTKEYLLSIKGLGLKSVECIRLLALQHLAFPVDTNVGRIAVRLGWVPLQPLPESLQLHLLELYPIMDSIQKYLWPRLCKLQQKDLYELHYQMITFGKVFCTKSKPNCNACPMRGECRHFASAFASARLALPAPEEKGIVCATGRIADPHTDVHVNALPLPPTQATHQLEGNLQLEACPRMDQKSRVDPCEPIIELPEEPASPEPESIQYQEDDIEDSLYNDDPDYIPAIKLNIEEFSRNFQHYMENNIDLQEGEMSKALVVLTPEEASIPMPKLKNVSRLQTEHQVYELPDSHPLLEGMDEREADDPCPYLLAIWTPGETANSIKPPEGGCNYQESGKLCAQKTCFACSSILEANSQIVRGTLLIPCRTATRGRFPLNGTYFQVNEVFADHASSLNPIDIPRKWLWKLTRKTVYFATSVTSIFRGLSTDEIQHCFWRGYVCVRGFDRKTRAPRPLVARLHFSASRFTKEKGRTDDK